MWIFLPFAIIGLVSWVMGVRASNRAQGPAPATIAGPINGLTTANLVSGALYAGSVMLGEGASFPSDAVVALGFAFVQGAPTRTAAHVQLGNAYYGDLWAFVATWSGTSGATALPATPSFQSLTQIGDAPAAA